MERQCRGCFEQYDGKYDMCPHCGCTQDVQPKEPFELELGTVLDDRYIIGNAIGLGGFGITYKAWDEKLEMVVAIKEYYPSSMVNRIPGTAEVIRFENKLNAFQFGLDRLIMEAQYMAQFNTHDNIVHVLSYFEANNTAYIVMEYLDGCTLGEFVQANGLKPWEESVDIVLQICEALNEIHKVGIIHRDISPDNIFMCNDGKVKLIDFGAARFAQNLESNYTVILKPGFAPPEQYTQVSEQGPWTDVYAVGATLYYLITGQKPEESTNRKMKDTLPEPIEIIPELPQYISDGIMKAMAIEPHLRFSAIEEFVAVIKKEKKVVSLKKEKTIRRTKRFAGIMSLLVVLGLVVFSMFSDISKKREDIVLQDAAIELWYVENPQGTLVTAYEAIIDEFCAEYPNVSVQIKGFESEKHLHAALDTGNPNIVQVDKQTVLTQTACLDLKTVADPPKVNIAEILLSTLKKNGGNDCVFLKDYAKYFPEQRRVPTGFSVPVLYVNTSLVSFEDDRIRSVSDLEDFIQAGHVVMMDEQLADMYRKLFGEKECANIVSGTVENFIAGNAAFFFGNTDHFFAVRTMPSQKTGVPKIARIDTDELPCEWRIEWSVFKSSEAQDNAAKRLLAFMLSENAQTKLFAKSDAGNALPLNQKALDTYCEIFDDLDFIPSDVKQCVFGEMR